MNASSARGSLRFSPGVFLLLTLLTQGVNSAFPEESAAVDRDASTIEVVGHAWHPGEVWDRIGKTQFFWNATVRNHSDVRKRVYLYYDLLDANAVPLARNVTNQYVGPHETLKIVADSYIMTVDLPRVTASRVTVKVGVAH